jgi:esterase/lipase
VLPGAEPVDLPGGPVGVLLSHGFTGTTQSIRPWAEHLRAAGPDRRRAAPARATAPAGRT